MGAALTNDWYNINVLPFCNLYLSKAGSFGGGIGVYNPQLSQSEVGNSEVYVPQWLHDFCSSIKFQLHTVVIAW